MVPNDMTAPVAPEQEVVLKAEAKLPGASLQKQADRFLAMVESYTIDSPETLQSAADDRNSINDRWGEIEEQRKFLKEPSLEQGRRIDGFFRPVLETLAKAKAIIGGKITAYSEAEQKRIAEEERQAREKSERAAAEQRAQAAKAQAEADAKAAELRRKAAEAEAAGKAGEAAKLASKAESVAVAGQEKAADLQTRAEMTAAAPVAVQQAPRMSGLAMPYTYSATVEDMPTFVRWIVEKRPDLITLLTVNQTALNGQARSLKDAMAFDGVKLVKTPQLRDARR